MSLAHDVEQVAYWIDHGESVVSIKKNNLAKELTPDEIDQVAVAYRQYKQDNRNEPEVSSRPLVYGGLAIAVGIFKIGIGGSMLFGGISVVVGIIIVTAHLVMNNRIAHGKDDHVFTMARSEMLKKMADDLEAARQQATPTI